MLLVTNEKFEVNLMLVNVNKLKPYKYMESKVETRIMDANVLGIECRWTSRGGFWYEGGRWRLCNI